MLHSTPRETSEEQIMPVNKPALVLLESTLSRPTSELVLMVDNALKKAAILAHVGVEVVSLEALPADANSLRRAVHLIEALKQTRDRCHGFDIYVHAAIANFNFPAAAFEDGKHIFVPTLMVASSGFLLPYHFALTYPPYVDLPEGLRVAFRQIEILAGKNLPPRIGRAAATRTVFRARLIDLIRTALLDEQPQIRVQ